jgi:hypothetical protein
MKDIEKLHDRIFDHLNSWSSSARNRNDELNPWFYLRSVRDERFKRGYWFPGNDIYICLSFWVGGDSNARTPNVFFELHEKHGCRAIIVSRDSESKYKYFEKLVRVLNDADNNKFVQNKKGKLWTKQFSNDFGQWHDYLTLFIVNDKRRIDEYISNNEGVEHEEFVSKFGFLTASDFDVMYSRVLTERNAIKERQYSEQRDFLSKPKLPLALLGITVESFQGIKKCNVGDFNPNSQWIFITGENGYGKTTFLQAIALGLSGDSDLEKYLDPKSRISIELVRNNEKAYPVRIKGNLSNLENYDFGQFVLGYGPSRLNVQSRISENKDGRGNNNVMSLFDSETLLKNINYELFASNYTDKRTFSELEDLVKVVTKGRISEVLISDREASFVETLSNGENLAPTPLSKLAAGFRSIINIVFDIYLRFRKVHLNLNYREFYGIVLIDEIENHLHPSLQRELPVALSEVFPNVQFIISTHSPITLLAASKDSMVLKVNRTKNDGVTIERLDGVVDFGNLLPNTILTSPIFGFDRIFSESRDEATFVRPETTYNEILENDEQASRIEKHLNKETTSEILRLLKK